MHAGRLMPESLWKNGHKNVLAYSWFPVVALLLVELSVAGPDVASLCCHWVTHPGLFPSVEARWCPWTEEPSCEKRTLLWDSFRLERAWAKPGAGWWAGFITLLHPGIGAFFPLVLVFLVCFLQVWGVTSGSSAALACQSHPLGGETQP